MGIIEMERRRREFAENTCRGRGWTEAQCAEVLAGVTIDPRDGRLTFETAGLSADHPLRQRMSGQYPVHQHMMVMGRIGDVPSYHHAKVTTTGEVKVSLPVDASFKADRFSFRGPDGEDLIERAKRAKRAMAEAAGIPRISSGSYHVDNGSPDDERGITHYYSLGMRGGSKSIAGPLLEEARRLLREARDGMAEYDRAMDDAIRTGQGWLRVDPRDLLPETLDPLAAMTCHRDTHTLEEREAPPKPAKPVLLVPAGCKLIVPFGFDLSPYDVRVDGSLGFEPSGAVTVMTVTGGAKPTPRGLTFEQPIQNRLGRMAR